MKLNVMERLTLLQILPKEGNFATLKITRELISNLGLSEADYKEFEINQKDGLITWNEKGGEDRAIVIGEKATDIIIESLKKLDEEKKLEDRHFSLYEKFVK